jgi:hypothetical protein
MYKKDAHILSIEYGKDKYAQTQYCRIDFEIDNDNKESVKQLVSKEAKIIEFWSSTDAYK